MSIYKMPSLGADMESGVLAEWKVKEGDKVKKGDIIADIETSKGVIEAEVYEGGTVEKIVGKEGVEYPVGTPLAVIRTEGESEEDIEKEISQIESEKPAKQSEKSEAEVAEKEHPATGEKKPQAVETHHVRATPLAKKRAKELGVDLEKLAQTVKGKISEKDVEEAAKKAKVPSFDNMRLAIAAAMSKSNAEIPHYYLSTPINMTPALEWLKSLNEQRSIKDRILPAAVMIRAVVMALQEVPELNGFWKDGGPVVSDVINPGIAIAMRKGGLVTPAIIDAHKMSLDETMKSLHDLIGRTRSGKLRSSEITQQTVTITNLGDLGVEKVFGVIYPPQVAIVGFGRIMDMSWVEGDAIAIRKVVQATLAGDHRATDGRTGGFFLAKLDKILQNPEKLL